MNRVAIDARDPDRLPGGADRWPLTEALETTDVAVNRYRVPPGAGLPGGLHAHADQEEVFVVVGGEATFEVLSAIDGEGYEVPVTEREAVRFGPGEFQSGRNAGDDELVVFALGAPRDTGDVRVPFGCPDCDDCSLRLDVSGVPPTFACPACGERWVAAACPECGGDDLGATLADQGSGAVVACRECGVDHERPPVEGGW